MTGHKTRIGTPKRSYSKYPKLVRDAINKLKMPETRMRRLSEKTGIPTSTLSDWKAKLETDPDFDPLSTKHGQHRRLFTQTQEIVIADYIRREFLSRKLLFTDADCQQVLQQFYNEFNEDIRQPSKGFIYAFKKRNGFSSRKAHGPTSARCR